MSITQPRAIMTTMSERITKSQKLKRVRKHGFMARMKTHGGRKMLKRRREEGRKQIAVSSTFV